ncbi:hypothetical protein N2K17_12670 [Klebsiella michiganensis]|uniref:hypothetical protein n=1 Tax=Klebsiella michiganensis TaxID=1134687 RepID=UPI002251CCE1|nr:hypothetical protein [Klebsiella michiganensis]MCX3081840.1 hypothetical protein [Klebsiella michiganensis]MCY0819868.1 hypothetical protein [Klebsiella michiganensis]
MGWSLPDVPARPDAQPWSPWVCLSIIFIGVFAALVRVVLSSPAGGLPALESGYWLPLTGYTASGIMIAIIFYSLSWEIRTFLVRNWNNWRRNMHLAWQYQAHQHLCVVQHVMLTADPQLLFRLSGGMIEQQDEASPLTLVSDEPVIPGISRFEQLCLQLIRQFRAPLIQRYPSGRLTVLIQTTTTDKEREQAFFARLWEDEALPWTPTIHVLPDELPYNDWNQRLPATHSPVLVLALHYRQPEEVLPEFACALLLLPDAMLKPSERRDAVRVFRAMPLNTGALPRELAELRDMVQQPSGVKHLVWHSGLSASSAQALGRVVNELPLHTDIAAGGIIDFAKISADYGSLAGWLMVAAATEMVNYGPGSHWLLQANDKHASAMVVGNSLPVIRDEAVRMLPLPYPAGSLCLAVLLNVATFGAVARFFPDWMFSWSGVFSMLLSLAVTLPGAVFLLRRSLTYLQRPRFIQAAGLAHKE